MLNKLTDKANILKAKITKDDLQQKLVSATSEQNWQAPTNILHEIANAAYNYEKWQKINDFIWDKLKKKSTWRKIVKTLNLVEFLLKNGPPSTISSFKYDIYQFRSFSDYQAYSEGVDRGQSIREKAKQIVDLLSNQELLQEQREKAKKIREKMASVTGSGVNYGGYGGSSGGYGDGKYQSYNNKSYTEKNGGGYGNSEYNGGGLGVYGDYSYGKSTLDKYKSDKDKNQSTKAQKQSNIPDITGAGRVTTTTAPNQPVVQQTTKKPFQKIAPKLSRPDAKKQAPKIIPSTQTSTTAEKTGTGNTSAGQSILDIDLFDVGTNPATATTTNNNNETAGLFPATNPVVQPVQPTQPIPVQTTQPVNFNQFYQQPQSQLQFNLTQPYGQSLVQPIHPQMGTPYGVTSSYGQPTYPQPVYNQPVAYSQQQQYQGGMNFNLSLGNTVQPSQNQPQQLNLSTKKDDDFGNFESAQSQSSKNVKWLNENQKGLIDFSDFTTEIKSNQSQPKKQRQQKGNNIQIDPWNW